MKQIHSIFSTGSHWHGLLLRFTLGLVIFPHGSQLFLGWFGGPGFPGAMAYFTQVEKLPWLVALSVILLQFAGSLLLIAGLAGRFLAIAFTGLFLGMILTSHLNHGFFMNWMGNQQGEGFEYHLLVIGMSLTLLVSGSGKYSLDAFISNRFSSPLKQLA